MTSTESLTSKTEVVTEYQSGWNDGYDAAVRMMRAASEPAEMLEGTPLKATPAFWLGEILAVIHGDGGHYEAEHGMAKATNDAIAKVINLRRDKDALEYRLAEPPKASEPHVIKQIEHALRDCPDKISREMADYITGCIADYRHAVTKDARCVWSKNCERPPREGSLLCDEHYGQAGETSVSRGIHPNCTPPCPICDE